MGGVRGWSEIPSCCQVETIGLCLRERWQGGGRDGVARPRQELVAFSLPTCSLIHGFCQQWTGSWVHLTGDFLVLVFSLFLSLSLSSLSLNLFALLWKRLKCQKLSSHEISPGAGDVVYHQLL